MIPVLRFVAAITAGMFITIVLLVAVEFFSSIVHPFPPDFGNTMDEMCQHVARYPQWVLAVVVPMWGFTAFAGTWTAKRIGGRGAAWFIGFLLMVGVLFNVSQLPYPVWFQIVSVLAIAAAIALASRRSADGIPPQ